MKTLQEIIKQTSVYLHNWSTKQDVICDFEQIYGNREDELKRVSPKYEDINILFASYGTDNYSGDAFVLYEREGKLYEVNGGHCSCYGLEGQFDPYETTIEELSFRLTKGDMGLDSWSDNEFANELKEFLGI